MHDGDPIISYKKNTTIGLRHVMTLDRQICATNEIVEEYKAVLEVGIRNVYFMRCFSSLPH